MERIESNNIMALQWLRYVLNPDTTAPDVQDWESVYDFAKKQSISGICLPEVFPDSISKPFMLRWIGYVQLIEQRNELINKRIEQLFEMMEQDGFECCLLKGQGNAQKYPNPLRRIPGDIDIWVNAEPEAVYRYVHSKFPNEEVSYKHIHFPIFSDVSVDVHVTPLKFFSRRNRKRLQCWIERNKEEQFAHKVNLSGVKRAVCVPTDEFNAVYQMGHMLMHLFDEGLGLRQVVDYYYVLKGLSQDLKERNMITDTIKDLGMLRFARALMWVENEVMGLPLSNCLVEPDERLGRQILNDILEGGNFGLHSHRFEGKRGFYHIGVANARRIMRLLLVAPIECEARLLRKMGSSIRYVVKKRRKEY